PRTVSQALCQHPQCNSSCFLAAVPLGPAFLRPLNCSAAGLRAAALLLSAR
ncbi:hypothetical protein KUCAC02_024087, partial [Chaenocephalus aceratus]